MRAAEGVGPYIGYKKGHSGWSVLLFLMCGRMVSAPTDSNELLPQSTQTRPSSLMVMVMPSLT